jgi:predicted ATPase
VIFGLLTSRVSLAVAAASLLERERELAEISAALGRASRGAGQALIVDGAAGIGKTALLDVAREQARARGDLVLFARGGEYELEFPFGVVRQLFEPVLASLGEEERARVLAGAAALAASLLGAVGASEFAGEDRSFTMLHGLYWLTANLADKQPVAAIVDDVQWADGASIRFLHYLARRLDGLAVTLILASRTGEDVSEPSILARLSAEPSVFEVRPAPLSAEAVETLTTHMFGHAPAAEFTAACVQSTGGTPFLVHELLRALREDRALPTSAAAERVPQIGPSTVAHATLLRLSRLRESAVALAQSVAVLGPAAETRFAAELAGVDPSDALSDADTLVAMGLLMPGSPLTFAHPIVRAAVHEDLGEGRRTLLHGRAADLLARAGGDPDAIAGHLLLAAPLGRADVAERLRAAATGALATWL